MNKKEAGGEVDFAGEEVARGLLATAVEIGHGKVLFELVMHNNENLNETIGPRAGIIVVRKISYYALCCHKVIKREPRQTRGRLPWQSVMGQDYY